MGLYNQPGTTLAISTTEPSADPEGQLWYDAQNDVLKSSDGSVFTVVGKTSFSSAAVVTHSSTIGDYSFPTGAVASSNGTVSGNPIFGLNSNQTSETFSTYTTQGEADTAYPTSNTAKIRVNITSDTLDSTGVMTVADNCLVHDLTSVSDSAWTLRFKITFSTLTASANNLQWFGLSSTAQTSGITASQDFLGGRFFYSAGTKDYGTIDTDGASPDVLADNTQAWTPATSTAYYVELKRTSTTAYTLEIFTGSDYATGSIGQVAGTCAATTATLRYLKFMGYDAVSEAGVQAYSVDDIQFWNNVSSNIAYAPNVFNTNTNYVWKSSAEANPKIYVDCGGSAANLLGMAIYLDSSTTETEIAIRASTDTTFTAGENTRTITVSNLTAGSWNYIRWNLVNRRYLQIYGNSGSSLVLGINQIKYLTKTDSQILQDLGILEISATDTGLALDGT